MRLKLKVILSVGLVLLTAYLGTAFAQTTEQNTYVRYVRTGMERMKSGDYQAARDSFQEALRYNDGGIEAHLGLGIVYYHEREDGNAERELNRVIELNPKEASAYGMLGELSYRRDDLESAQSYWEKAVALSPEDASLRARLERIRKEQKTERDFNRDMTSHFLVKYEGREKMEAGRIILNILEDAYSEIGGALSFYPEREIQVILYSGRQFQEVTDAPGWSGALFDGKIRIPIGGIDRETTGLRRMLYHEYTHAVVRAITPRCPTWLNEGLAQYFEGREIDPGQRAMLRQMAQAGKLPSLASLEGSFMGLEPDQAAYAYLVSLSSVRYLVDSFGMYRAKAVLEVLSTGADTGKAIDEGTTLSYQEFERGWKKSLE